MQQRDGDFTPLPDRLQYGISNLHGMLRSFDWACKAAKYQDVKDWQVHDDIDKAAVKARTRELQTNFKEKLQLDVFMPRTGAASGGNSNTGNVCRKAFDNPDEFAACLGGVVPVGLIKKFKMIFNIINCPLFVNPDVYFQI